MNSVILYRGPSRIHRDPVVVVATGLKTSSKNPKTGNEVQTWILPDNGRTILESLKLGKDKSVCGTCKHRPYLKNPEDEGLTIGSCYLRHEAALQNISRALISDRYPNFKKKHLALFKGRVLRLGSYGNPSVIPLKVWRMLMPVLDGWTGYDHNWKDERNKAFAEFLMASVDSPEEKRWANSLGWRTFRTKLPEEPILPDEVVCPASAEAGYKTTCERCQLCRGNTIRAKNVVINIHGVGFKQRRYEALRGKRISLL